MDCHAEVGSSSVKIVPGVSSITSMKPYEMDGVNQHVGVGHFSSKAVPGVSSITSMKPVSSGHGVPCSDGNGNKNTGMGLGVNQGFFTKAKRFFADVVKSSVMSDELAPPLGKKQKCTLSSTSRQQVMTPQISNRVLDISRMFIHC